MGRHAPGMPRKQLAAQVMTHPMIANTFAHGSMRRAMACAFVAGILAATAGSWAAGAADPITVSQKGRAFRPGEISVSRGDTITIVNDDADLLHHVFIDSDKLKFDSGDQRPGTQTRVTFPASGTFDVLCAIHPKMKLVVHVK